MAEQVGGIYYTVSLETGQMIRGQRQVQATLDDTSGALDRFGGKLSAITRAISIYAAALAVVRAANTADDVRLLGARMEVAAGSTQAAATAMAELQRISTSTQTSVAANVQVFTRLNQSILQMGGNQSDTLRVTDLLAKSIKVSGASAQEASAAMLQFGQALGSGRLQGDELRSLSENAPYLMRQLADALGVPVGALKKLGEDGKLTADVVVNALSKAADKINADFEKLGPTLSGAFTVAKDAASRLVEKVDEVTGRSAQLTGVVQGLGQVLDRLADQFGAANTEAGKLGRNELISTWADRTRVVLSYVVDAADGIQRVFQIAGIAIGALAAKAEALTTFNLGKFRERNKAIEEASRAELDLILQQELAGKKMRDLWEQGAGGGRGVVNPPQAAPSKLTPPKQAPDKSTFDALAYLAKLEQATQEGVNRINLIEQEALRKNQELLKEGKISREQAAKAAVLIEADAAQERERIQFEESGKQLKAIEDRAKARAAAAVKEAQERRRLLDMRGQALVETAGDDPIARLQFELQRKSDMLAEFAERDQAGAELYANARVALEQQTQQRIAEIIAKQQFDQLNAQANLLGSVGQFMDSVGSLLRGNDQQMTATQRAAFAAAKAFALAQGTISLYSASLKAMDDPTAITPAQKFANYAAVFAAGAGLLNTIRGVQYGGGRQYGGPASTGNLYRINETGAPEMFTAANGAQYMLPTSNGRVTPADQLGGGGGVTVVIQNTGTPQQVQSQSFDRDANVVRLVTADLVEQIDSNSGPVMSALKRSTNVQPRLGG